MSRLVIPESIEAAPQESRALLQAVQQQLGSVPNLFRMVSTSPAALEGYLALSSALGKGRLKAQTRGRIAMAVAEVNRCGYCLAAHTYLGKNLAHLSDEELTANRKGTSLDPQADAAVRFAAKVVRERGHLSAQDVEEVKKAGYDDAQILEIVLHVALNTWTNYINEIAQTEIDFPKVAILAD